jgi:hypothetical protein
VAFDAIATARRDQAHSAGSRISLQWALWGWTKGQLADEQLSTEKPKLGEDLVLNRRNTVDVIGDHNDVRIGHVGDVHINHAPEPELQIVSNIDKVNDDGSHTRVIRLRVLAPYVPGRLQIEANAHNVIDGDIHPVRGGTIMFGSELRPDCFYVSVERPSGEYDLVIKSAAHSVITIRFAFD